MQPNNDPAALDLWIAEHIYGAPSPIIDFAGRVAGGTFQYWTPWTQDASAMLDLIDAMRQRGWRVQLTNSLLSNDSLEWHVRFTDREFMIGGQAVAATPMLAVAQATRRAIEAQGGAE